MKIMFFSHRRRKIPLSIYITNLFFSLHYAATLYVASSYLETFFPTQYINLFFVFGAVGNIILFLVSPYLLKHLGNRRFLFSLLAIEILSTFGLAYGASAISVGLFFILRGSVIALIYYSLDIFLEETSSNKNTGRIRGLYLTVTNLAIACAPLLVAYFALGDRYQNLYWISSFLLIPPLLLSIFAFHDKLPHSKHTEKRSLPFRRFIESKNLKHVTLCALSLQLFFAFMVIYTPIYLHDHLGFNWQQIGIAFTIMLLPFVIFEWPIGRLADKKYGEKEIMSLGFFLMGLALIIIPFLGRDLVWWTAILFLSRVGASFVEITTESYFFKHVDSRDTGFINIYRLVGPTALILGPIIGMASVYLFSFSSSFFVIALLVFYGLKQSLHLKDTR